MKKLILFSLLGLGIIACNKQECEKLNFGTLVITNLTNENIQFHFDGVNMYELTSLKTETLEIDPGLHTFGAKRYQSNTPDSMYWNESVNISLCQKEEYIFEF